MPTCVEWNMPERNETKLWPSCNRDRADKVLSEWVRTHSQPSPVDRMLFVYHEALAWLTRGKTKSHEIWDAFNHLKRSDCNITIDTLDAQIRKRRKEQNVPRVAELLTVYLPLYTPLSWNRRRVMIRTCEGKDRRRFAVWTRHPSDLEDFGNKIADRVKFQDGGWLMKSRLQPPRPESLLVVRQPTIFWQDGLVDAFTSLEIARGMIELASSIYTVEFFLGASPPPWRRRRVHFYDFVLSSFQSETKIDRMILPTTNLSEPTDVRPARAKDPISEDDIKFVHYLSRQVIRSSAIRAWMLNIARLYGNMTDQEDYSTRLLATWQLAECLAFGGGRNGDTGVTARRLAAMATQLGGPTATYTTLLEWCAACRNNLVHAAVSDDINDRICSQFKYICDQAIKWLISQHEAIGSQDIAMQVLSLLERTPSSRADTAAATRIVAGPRSDV